MAVLPPTLIEQLQFCEAHWPIWDTAPTTIGLTAGQVSAFKTQTITVRNKFDAAQAARIASKSATTELHGEAGPLKTSASDLIRQIKAYADLQANPSIVYAAAGIPEPLPPTPLPAPGVPNFVRVELETSGAVTLSWEAVNAAASSGAFYNISRKLPGQSTFVSIGGAPGSTAESRRMSFTDTTVPTSAAGAGVQYQIQGQRGTTMGIASEGIVVQFGTDGGGSFSVAGTTMKIAA